MNLYDLFFDEERRSAAVIGGGGKTTLLAGVAEAAKNLKRPLVLSTSTKLQCPCPIPSAAIFEGPDPPDETMVAVGEPPVLWVGSKTSAGDKWIGPPIGTLESLISRHSTVGNLSVIIEADGSAGRPIKAPGPNEPVIPEGIATVAAVIGLSALGRPVSEETVHRLETFLKITGVSTGDIISPELLIRLILHPAGSFKGTVPGMRRLLIINQADTPQNILDAKSIAEAVMKIDIETAAGGQLSIDMVIVSSLRNDYKIRSIIGP